MILEYFSRNDEVVLTGISDFDLTKTFECGQCFRWDADEGGEYTGVVRGKAVRLRNENDNIIISCSVEDFELVWRNYFDLDRNYKEIRELLSIDDFMLKATEFGIGIRLLRQEKWEALCSFIISQCNNIPRIKKIITTLCREFGDRFEYDGKDYYSFPSAQKLASLDEHHLAPLRCGYRASYILSAAQDVSSGKLDLETLSKSSPEAARSVLKKLHGVGEKVADCAMLFGLNMLDTFPRDVWMNRAIAEYFSPSFDPAVFSPYAGIAQQYIFHYVRNG